MAKKAENNGGHIFCTFFKKIPEKFGDMKILRTFASAFEKNA